MKRAVQLGAVLLLVSLAASAGETRVYREGNIWVQEITGSLAPMKKVRVSTPAGAVKVVGSPQQQNITYKIRKRAHRAGSEEEARRLFEQTKVTVWPQGETAIFRAQAVQWSRQSGPSTDFEIQVPRDTAAIDADTQGGPVEVRGINGTVDARSAGGSITLDDVSGQSMAFTNGGAIHVGRAGSDVRLKTHGGPIEVVKAEKVFAWTAGGPVKVGSATMVQIQTMGGSIDVEKCDGDLLAHTAGGNIDVGSAGKVMAKTSGGNVRVLSADGPVKVQTAGGGVRLMGLRYGVAAQTAVGTITAEFLPGIRNFTDSLLTTTAGDIIVYLPEDLAVTVNATVELGEGYTIRAADFPALTINKAGQGFGPRPITAQGTLNGGGPLLKLHTANGNIELRKTRKGQR